MKKLIIFFLFLVICLSVVSQNTGNDAASIRAQMSAIRKSTNWSDAAAAKAANAKIQELSAKLTQALRQGKPPAQQPGSGDLKPEEAAKIQQDNDDYGNKLWNQMMKIVREGGKWDLAEPLRKEIVEEYKEDENPTIKSPDWIQSMPVLTIDMSMPGIKAVIDQMPVFRGIKILIITCEKKGTSVDLGDLLKKAKDYPLEKLYILNFGPSVSSLPDEAGNFQNLNVLSLFSNQISQLPATLSKLSQLNTLQLDLNPFSTLIKVISPLKKLKYLSIAKTDISETEVAQIHQLFPDCEIQSK